MGSTTAGGRRLDLGQHSEVWFISCSHPPDPQLHPSPPEPQSAETSPVLLTQSSAQRLGLPHSRGGQLFPDERHLEQVSSNDCPPDPQ